MSICHNLQSGWLLIFAGLRRLELLEDGHGGVGSMLARQQLKISVVDETVIVGKLEVDVVV